MPSISILMLKWLVKFWEEKKSKEPLLSKRLWNISFKKVQIYATITVNTVNVYLKIVFYHIKLIKKSTSIIFNYKQLQPLWLFLSLCCMKQYKFYCNTYSSKTEKCI